MEIKKKENAKNVKTLGILNKLESDDLGLPTNEIDINLLDFSSLNFYRDMDNEDDIKDLAESIKSIGLLHNIVVRPDKKGRYVVLSGEKRTKAYMMLYKETNDAKWKSIPCKIREDINNVTDEELALIIANRDVRERNDLIKAKEIERLEAIYTAKKAAGEKVGIIRKRIAADMNISETQVQRLKQVNELIPEFKDMLATGDIQLSTVEHFTGFEKEVQKDILESIMNLGYKISREEALVLKNEVKAAINASENIEGSNTNNDKVEAAGHSIAAVNQDETVANTKDTSDKANNSIVKETVTKAKPNIDITPHIKKALSSVKSLASKLTELSQSKKKLSPENKDAINEIKALLDSINI